MDQTLDNTEKISVQDNQDDSHTDADASVYEARAREMDWKPKEQFKGDPSKWIDAKAYVERAETVLPVVKGLLRKTREELEEVKKAAQNWVELNKADTARRETEWKAKLSEAIQSKKDAIAQGDGDKVIEAEATIDDLKASKPQPQKEAPKVDPVFTAWKAENPWYGTDRKRTLKANVIGADLSADDPETGAPGLRGRVLYDAVLKEMEEQEQAAQGTARAGPQRAGKAAAIVKGDKSYENLKPEFREKCDTQFKYFGSKGTPEAWRKSWISQATDDMFRS